jgi:hypothetical protein
VRSKVEIIGPSVSPNETPKISVKEFDALLNESQASRPKVVPKEGIKKKDIKMEVDKFSPNGEMGLNFN